MNIDEFTEWLYKGNEPTEADILDFAASNVEIHGSNRRCVYSLVGINQKGKFQGMERLKMLILLYNLVQELNVMDRILGAQPDSPHFYLYELIGNKIMKVFNRVSSAAKYKKHDHILNITYETKEK